MSPTDPPADRHAAELRAFLAERDVACPGCGYNLRGLTSVRCPECELELCVNDIQKGLLPAEQWVRCPGSASVAAVAWFLLFCVAVLSPGDSQGPDELPVGIVAFFGTVATLLCCFLCFVPIPRARAMMIALLTRVLALGMLAAAVWAVWF